jgi:CheY-like chemotaxis protein/HPt (histidine-containing phosphotransfer) domain-containing protein
LPRLLVVDDSEACRRLAADLLVEADYAVDVVGDGPAAIEAARKIDYALVLMDVRMPGMSGEAAAGAIRELGEGRSQVAIVATTSLAPGELDRVAPGADFDGYLRKPLSAASLLPVVERWLGAFHGAADADEPVLDSAVLDQIRDDLGAEGFGEVLDVFADEIFNQLDQLPGALERGALEVVELCAHRVRGGAATVGATGLERHAAALEDAARHADTDGVKALCASIVPCARQVHDAVVRLRQND